MPPIEKKRGDYQDIEHKRLTSIDLQNILEVNKKAIEIHIEVANQNEDVIENLSTIVEKLTSIDKKIDDLDKMLFKLIIALGGIGVGTIFGIIELLYGHK